MKSHSHCYYSYCHCYSWPRASSCARFQKRPAPPWQAPQRASRSPLSAPLHHGTSAGGSGGPSPSPKRLQAAAAAPKSWSYSLRLSGGVPMPAHGRVAARFAMSGSDLSLKLSMSKASLRWIESWSLGPSDLSLRLA